jgi:hypothetical protein
LDEFGVELSCDPAKFLFEGICYVQTTTIHTDNHKVDYELSRSKAIKQTIEAAERPLSVVVKLAMGGIFAM